ncbi:MAG: hypothetical protein IPN70_02240 [Candidatus Moraniibacteriota bacterium]|nr:MAG: hypothetical protein IPN70_02240 [Candidatus Moranbacteria bacterium]
MRRFFLCSQNNDSKNYRFIQSEFSDFVAAEFPKTPSPKPARIPPQTPPAGGKFSRGFAKSFPPENSFGKTESAFRPATLPEYLEGRTPKEKHPFLFQKKIHPRQIRNARSVFSFGVAEALRGGGGAIHSSSGLVSKKVRILYNEYRNFSKRVSEPKIWSARSAVCSAFPPQNPDSARIRHAPRGSSFANTIL